MSAEIRSRECVSLRDAQPADLPAVLGLLGRAHLPTAGVADALPHFVIAEDGGRIVGGTLFPAVRLFMCQQGVSGQGSSGFDRVPGGVSGVRRGHAKVAERVDSIGSDCR
jgi:hypothetical protein